jgi:hypothetical protein
MEMNRTMEMRGGRENVWEMFGTVRPFQHCSSMVISSVRAMVVRRGMRRWMATAAHLCVPGGSCSLAALVPCDLPDVGRCGHHARCTYGKGVHGDALVVRQRGRNDNDDSRG